MGYLLVQMALCLACAGILGLCLGWLVQDRKITRLKRVWSKREQEYRTNINRLEAFRASSNKQGDESWLSGEVNHDIEEIEGIGSGYARALRNMDINTTGDLLVAGKQPLKIIEAAETLKVDELDITQWIRKADLMRVPGVSGKTPELLESSGVTSVKTLSKQDPGTLSSQLKSSKVDPKISAAEISDQVVSKWIQEAEKLEGPAAAAA